MAINVYGFTYPSHIAEMRLKKRSPKDDCLPYLGLRVKVGDSHRDAAVRMGEQGGSAEAEAKIIVGVWDNITSFNRDYDLHEVMVKAGWRPKGYLTGHGTEWFIVPGKDLAEVKSNLEWAINTFGPGTSLKDAKLRKMQDRSLKQAMDTINRCKKNGQKRVNIVANLCPRFGKTIWALELFNKLNKKYGTQVMILPAYWLSVHTSFADEVSKFRDFMNMVVIDTREEEAEAKVRQALKDGKQVVVQLSLHGDLDEWKEKTAWVQSIAKDAFVFSDEADFGSHTENQVAKLRFILEQGKIKTSVNIFASGTNIQRIALNARGQKVDDVIDVAYSQLEATERTFVRRNYYSLRYDGLYELLESEYTENRRPSWSKIWAKPLKCTDFLSTTMDGLLGYNDDLCGLNLSHIVTEATEEESTISCVMLLTSATKNGMRSFGKLCSDRYTDYEVVVLNGDHTSNKEAEDLVRGRINEAKLRGKKGLLIIANMMGSRSFSVPEIQATVIMYDCGSVDATSQKTSRCLTPGKDWYGNTKTRGHIVSFSFDPNRNEQIENLVLYEAIQISRSEGISFAEAVKIVNKTVNIYRMHEEGDPILVKVDELFEVYGENENLLKVADITPDLSLLFEKGIIDILSKIAAGDSKTREKMEKLAPKAKKLAETGETDATGKKAKKDKDQKEMEKLVNQAIRSINRSALTVYNMAMGGSDYRDCLVRIGKSDELAEEFADLYGITVTDTMVLVDENVLNVPLLDVVVENGRKVFDTDIFEML